MEPMEGPEDSEDSMEDAAWQEKCNQEYEEAKKKRLQKQSKFSWATEGFSFQQQKLFSNTFIALVDIRRAEADIWNGLQVQAITGQYADKKLSLAITTSSDEFRISRYGPEPFLTAARIQLIGANSSESKKLWLDLNIHFVEVEGGARFGKPMIYKLLCDLKLQTLDPEDSEDEHWLERISQWGSSRSPG